MFGGAVLCGLEPTHQGFQQHLCTSAHHPVASVRSLWVQKQHREHRCGLGSTRAVPLTAPTPPPRGAAHAPRPAVETGGDGCTHCLGQAQHVAHVQQTAAPWFQVQARVKRWNPSPRDSSRGRLPHGSWSHVPPFCPGIVKAETWMQVPPLSLTSCVTLGRALASLSLSFLCQLRVVSQDGGEEHVR